MMQLACKQNTTSADAAMCAPATCDARMSNASVNTCLDTAICAVSIFIVLVLAAALRLSVLIGLLALIIMSLLVWNKQGSAKSVFARIPEPA